MSSARQLLTIGGQLAGAALGFGAIGAAIGGVIGGELGGVIDGPPEGPRLDDLSAPQVQYGGKIPRFYGGPKWFEVGLLWASEKREDSETVGGKGGDSGVEQFSYRSDLLFRVCESREGTPCEVIAVTGVEIDGERVWTALADSDDDSIINSESTEDWADMTVLLGHEDQAPWSVMEAAEGADDANAYRGYLTVGFSDFLLGPNGMPRRVRIQAITAGTQEPGLVYALWNFNDSEGSSAVTDGSSWGNDGVATGMTQSTASAAFGTTGMRNTGTGGSSLSLTGMSVPWNPSTTGHTAEGRMRLGVNPNVTQFTIGQVTIGGDAALRLWVNDDLSPDQSTLVLTAFGESVNGDTFAGPAEYCLPIGSVFSWVIDWDEVTNTARAKINGEIVLTLPVAGSIPGASTINAIETATIGSNVAANNIQVDGVRFATRRFYPGSSGPANVEPTADDGPWTVGEVALRDILEYEAERCTPLTSANIDFSAAAGINVDCHVVIGSAAEAMQPLLTRFWFDLYSADKLYLVRRGGSVEQTIPFRWTGANGDPFAGLLRGNDVEVPKRKAITFNDILKDGEADTRTGDREGVGTDTDTLQLNLHMVPTEAQGLADTATADARVAAHTATIRVGARNGLLLQPGSVFQAVDHKGNSYRLLARRIVWNAWAWEVEVRLDDPNVLRAAGIAVDLDQRALTVAPPPSATLYVLDIPLLRAQDDGPGEYAAVTQTGRFRGVAILKSSDDITYNRLADVTARATAGVCDSALGAFTGWGWDNTSTLTVTLDDGSGGTLSSATKTAIEASRSLNLIAVGVHGRWELMQFATATLLTGTTYTLSGFLRNLLGTEANNANHESGDSFVVINAALVRLPGSVSDLGQTRYYKAVPSGRSAGSVTAESIECEEQCLLPYAPVDLRNDAGTVRWNRRSRLEGAIGIDPPLGEVSERYDAEQYSGVTLDDSEAGLTTAEWTPSPGPSGKTVRVYQLSDLVGRGHVAEKALP